LNLSRAKCRGRFCRMDVRGRRRRSKRRGSRRCSGSFGASSRTPCVAPSAAGHMLVAAEVEECAAGERLNSWRRVILEVKIWTAQTDFLRLREIVLLFTVCSGIWRGGREGARWLGCVLYVFLKIECAVPRHVPFQAEQNWEQIRTVPGTWYLVLVLVPVSVALLTKNQHSSWKKSHTKKNSKLKGLPNKRKLSRQNRNARAFQLWFPTLFSYIASHQYIRVRAEARGRVE
jgi:hypothetical protein